MSVHTRRGKHTSTGSERGRKGRYVFDGDTLTLHSMAVAFEHTPLYWATSSKILLLQDRKEMAAQAFPHS